jgi:hypothetical protein
MSSSSARESVGNLLTHTTNTAQSNFSQCRRAFANPILTSSSTQFQRVRSRRFDSNDVMQTRMDCVESSVRTALRATIQKVRDGFELKTAVCCTPSSRRVLSRLLDRVFREQELNSPRTISISGHMSLCLLRVLRHCLRGTVLHNEGVLSQKALIRPRRQIGAFQQLCDCVQPPPTKRTLPTAR